jgi:hypothetical protein
MVTGLAGFSPPLKDRTIPSMGVTPEARHRVEVMLTGEAVKDAVGHSTVTDRAIHWLSSFSLDSILVFFSVNVKPSRKWFGNSLITSGLAASLFSL